MGLDTGNDLHFELLGAWLHASVSSTNFRSTNQASASGALQYTFYARLLTLRELGSFHVSLVAMNIERQVVFMIFITAESIYSSTDKDT